MVAPPSASTGVLCSCDLRRRTYRIPVIQVFSSTPIRNTSADANSLLARSHAFDELDVFSNPAFHLSNFGGKQEEDEEEDCYWDDSSSLESDASMNSELKKQPLLKISNIPIKGSF